jgi:hypothetical protein
VINRATGIALISFDERAEVIFGIKAALGQHNLHFSGDHFITLAAGTISGIGMGQQ